MSRKPHQFGKTAAPVAQRPKPGDATPAAAYRATRATRASAEAAETDSTRQMLMLGAYCGGGLLVALAVAGFAAKRFMS